MEHKVDNNDFDRCRKEVNHKLDNLKFVFWNIYEGEQKDSGCVSIS